MQNAPLWPRSGNDSGEGVWRKVAQVAKPETILGWFRQLVAEKFDGPKHRSYPRRPKIDTPAAWKTFTQTEKGFLYVLGGFARQAKEF